MSVTTYATWQDLVKRFDERTIKDLVSDDGTAVEDLSASDKLTAALDDAAGRMEAACYFAQIYSATDLSGLTGHSLALFKRIQCEITMAYLLGRRPEKYGTDFFSTLDKRAEDFLDRLRKGERLFDSADQKEAGVPSVDGPTALDFQDLNLITARVTKFYPHYSRRLPIGRQG